MRVPVAGRRFALAAFVIQVAACGGSSDSASPTNPNNPAGPTLTGPGATWTAVTAPSGTTNWRGVAYGNGIWVAGGQFRRASSVDGTTWTSVAVTTSSYYNMTSVVFANGVFVMASTRGVSTSTNGTSWSSQVLDAAESMHGLAYGNGTWVMADNRFLNTDVVAFMVSTTNGAGWQQVLTNIPYAQPTGVAFGNGVFVTVGYGGLVARSTNTTTWTQQNLGSTSDLGLMAVTYANGQFVAVTNSGKAYRSTDGITWTKVTVTVNALYAIAYGNGVFAAVGQAGSIYTSADAATWTVRTWSGPNATFEGVFFGNNRFVASGDSFATSQ